MRCDPGFSRAASLLGQAAELGARPDEALANLIASIAVIDLVPAG